MADKHDTLGHQQHCLSPMKASLPEHYLILKQGKSPQMRDKLQNLKITTVSMIMKT